MADIKNKNELKRRIDLFLDDFSHEEYIINEPFCKETMRMMREFVGHASHLLDCADAKIKKAKRTARNKAIDEFAKEMKWEYRESIGTSEREIHFALAVIDQVADRLKGGAE